ncbi:WXG100 family type VII secretion target [Streptomyces sp. NBC_01218]|uniref:WXG100 family type VII secretion target n=1 Tax=unclassified Streptomyces TaxID=2593676 RepID=UPI0023B9DE60|nr:MULTISPECIES: WXG100 family type VII secretion target [unclassified Streptomyces]WEH39365.1 WXG100 family type VII secretion target [Streptomyces sp. AM 2-1-1]WSQ51062.1 WXG100 family type VII secretion target [Streptomyces sp. NBC_01218]
MSNNDGTTVVTYSSLEAAAASIERQGKQLDEDLAAIKRRVASVSELWQGEAKGAYDTAQAGWDKDARAIHESLLAISRAVREAAPAYQGGDKKAAQNFM